MSRRLLATGVFVGAGLAAGIAAWASALAIESRSAQAVRSGLMGVGITWATVEANGLQLHLSGTAPNEAARFRAVNLAGSIVDASRVRDHLEVTPVSAIEAPHFSLEVLRNDDGIQLIGLLPASSDVDALLDEAEALDAQNDISDMIETADYPAPPGWDAAFAFGIEAVRRLPRSKVSISVEAVEVTAIADSLAEQRKLEGDLANLRPASLPVHISISAPRPVLTPFTLRFVLDGEGARFDACAADTERARDRILAAGIEAGVTGRATCTVGLGVPSPSWAEAVSLGIAAVRDLGDASVTFSDADVTLTAASSVPQAEFDRVLGELQTDLPDVFSLTATLEKKTDVAAGPAEFTAVLQPEGRVELRGRVTDELLRDTVESVAQAQFGVGNVYMATRLDEELPDGWPIRVLAGLEALSELAQGRVVVRADSVAIEGVTGSQGARDRVAQILSDKLGQGQTFRISVRYDEALDPLAALPTPEECAASVKAVLDRRKITFPPGSAEIDGPTAQIMEALAKVLEDCSGVRMEIAGHTDSQGSEGGNLALSQARAEAVLLALQGRGIDVTGLTAKGYGEAVPIADNGSEEGREANRRIEFTLLQPVAAIPGAAEADPSEEPTTAAVATGDEVVGEDDDDPSLAPQEKTRRPLARPARDG
jgi:OOP family OmpA-OmpF porin